MVNNAGTNNAIGGNFKSIDGRGHQNKWEFEYKQNNDFASLNIFLHSVETSEIGLSQPQLTADLHADDLNQLIRWLEAVQSQLSS